MLTLVLFLATYYVTPTGSDTSPGTCTLANPCREVQKAITLVGAGDTILVADGSYLGFNVNGLVGTAGNPITVQAQGTGANFTVTTNRPDNRDTILVTGGSEYIILDGLNAANATRAGVRVDACHHVTIRNGVYANNGTWGIFTNHSDYLLIEDNIAHDSVGQHGMYISNSGDHATVRRNVCYGNDSAGIQFNGDVGQGGDGIMSFNTINDNIMYDNGAVSAAALNLDGVQDSYIYNNLIYDNIKGGIAMWKGDSDDGPKGNFLYHNTVVMPTGARWPIQITNCAGLNTLRNNIMWHADSGKRGLEWPDAPCTNDSFDSNYNVMAEVWHGFDGLITLAAWQAYGKDLNSFWEPTLANMFVSPGTDDYHVKSGGPLQNGGTTVGAVTTDLDGHSRPQGSVSDIGAYEFEEAGAGGTIRRPCVRSLCFPGR